MPRRRDQGGLQSHPSVTLSQPPGLVITAVRVLPLLLRTPEEIVQWLRHPLLLGGSLHDVLLTANHSAVSWSSTRNGDLRLAQSLQTLVLSGFWLARSYNRSDGLSKAPPALSLVLPIRSQAPAMS